MNLQEAAAAIQRNVMTPYPAPLFQEIQEELDGPPQMDSCDFGLPSNCYHAWDRSLGREVWYTK